MIFFRTDLNFQTPNSFGNLRAYSQSKLANVLHAKKLARELSDTTIKVVSLHPGVICKLKTFYLGTMNIVSTRDEILPALQQLVKSW